MSTSAVNPFVAPLQSELQEHQAAQAKTVAASPNGNPLDEPFASEKAENNGGASSQDKSFYQNYMDGGNPAASYGGATRYGLDSVAQGTLDAVKGAANLINPTAQNDGERDAFKVAGIGGVLAHRLFAGVAAAPHEIAQAIHDINQSKDPTGTFLEHAQKVAAKGAGQALLALGTAGVVKGVSAVAPKVSGLASDVIEGESKAQAPAKAALSEASGTEGAVRGMLDEPIKQLATKERASYDTINKNAGMDMKSLYDFKNKLEDALEDPAQISNEERLTERLKQTTDQINAGEYAAKAAGQDMNALEQAKAMTKQRYALEDVSKKVFSNEGVVSGNTAHGATESINVNSAIRQVENLDKPSRFAPRGTPYRLEQAFGSDKAKALKQGLYDAQNAGQKAVSRQKAALWVGGITGAGLLTSGAAEGVHLLNKK